MRYSINILVLFVKVIILLILPSCSPAVLSTSHSKSTITPTIKSVVTHNETVQTTISVTTDYRVSQSTEITLIAKWTPYPTSLITTSSHTWTPNPTLSSQEAHALVGNLLKNNGGCLLPCWWGMIPGKTDWNATKRYLETFVKSIEPNGEGKVIRDGLPIHWAHFLVRYEIDNGVEDNFSVLVENGIIKEL